MSDNGRDQWGVSSSRPWWHRGAATAAMIALVNMFGFMWAGETRYVWLTLAFAVILGSYDMTQNK